MRINLLFEYSVKRNALNEHVLVLQQMNVDLKSGFDEFGLRFSYRTLNDKLL